MGNGRIRALNCGAGALGLAMLMATGTPALSEFSYNYIEGNYILD